MSADDWNITMVALVDKPAVTKATYVIMRRAPDGQAQIAPAPAGTQQSTRGETGMRKINRIALYHDEAAPATGATGSEPEPNPPAAGAGEEATESGETIDGPDLASTIKAVFAEQMESLKDQVQGMIDASLQPLKDSVTTLETRQARFSGAGALPGSGGESGGEGEERVAPSWVNYGTRPRRVEAVAQNGKS